MLVHLEWKTIKKMSWLGEKPIRVLKVGKSLFHRVRGELKPNPDLAKFHFNEAGFFTNKTFAEMIMNHPHCFANKGEAKSLRKSLQNYQAKFNTLVNELLKSGA